MSTGGPSLNDFVLFLSFAAITGFPQLLIREKYPVPSYFISGGGGLQLLLLVWRWTGFERLPIPHVVFITLSLGAILYGILQILDLRFPTRGYLPQALTRNRTVDKSDLFLPGFIGFFAVGYGVLGVVGGMHAYGGRWDRLASSAAIVALLVGWVWFKRRYIALHWVLQRRPEAVVWTFVQSTRVTRNGVYQGTYWSAQVGLDSGQLLGLSTTQADAEQIAAEVAHVCPHAAIGYSPDLVAQFNKDPKSVRRAPPPPT